MCCVKGTRGSVLDPDGHGHYFLFVNQGFIVTASAAAPHTDGTGFSLSAAPSTVVVVSLRLDSLRVGRGLRDRDVKILKLFVASRKTNFQFEIIGAGEILSGAIQGDKGRHLRCQALLEIGGLEHRAPYADSAMRRGNGEPNRRQWTGGAIRANAHVDTNAHLPPREGLNFPLDRIGLRADVGRARVENQSRDKPENCSHQSRHRLS